MIKQALTALFLMLICSQASAREPLKLIGETRLQVMFWSIYDIRLYSHDGFYRPGQAPLKLELHYLSDFEAATLIKRTGEEWKQLGINDPERTRWLNALAELWPDVTENDVLAMQLDCAHQSHFYFNNKKIGTMTDKRFGTAFLAIWLSPKTSQPEMRRKLLANKEQPRSLKSTSVYHASRPACQF